ncbi:hypothetical protein ABB55_17730 [Prosthecomicrobium hirschii]|uniref:VWFA domain-containing protein n=1 Tax=Prosthecodimorpha hirschii TaxID=665126 RepID=A0A0P6W961_9HYPH|nr:VWA domain-containing protein [Prosthecomicrobium hirschii]KPL53820.1 hypothetical protein ABB55_17730 [Prosthecomicrobium hirschii]
MDWHALLEPEETVGKLWHRFFAGRATLPAFEAEAVAFEAVRGAIGPLFRGLGGPHAVEIKAAEDRTSHHRLTLAQRLGRDDERLAGARLTGDALLLPARIAQFPDRALNRQTYLWLAGYAVAGAAIERGRDPDPLRDDILALRHAVAVTAAVEARFPGLAAIGRRLAAATLALRPERRLPPCEMAIETAISHALGRTAPPLDTAIVGCVFAPDRGFGDLKAPVGYRPFLPIILWGEIMPDALRPPGPADPSDPEETPGTGRAPEGAAKQAKRRRHDQVDRPDPFVAHRFEKILTWAEFMNIHRDVEDDDEDSARKAAEDHDHLALARLSKKASTRLAFDLDLAPEDIAHGRLAGTHLYPEWDCRRAVYRPDHVRVLAGPAAAAADGSWAIDAATARRIRAVRRRFEALAGGRERLRGRLDGQELDMDALVRSLADLKATGAGSDRVYESVRNTARDLAVTVLVDVSRSTEAYADGLPVIEVARQALVAFTEGLTAVGDAHQLLAFSSLRRDRVRVDRIKDFDETLGAAVRARIGGLKPGHYTRLGAALRHATAGLSARGERRRLLIVLTDGKPNDLDRYEGRYGIEDTRKAVDEARAKGIAVFGITIDREARSYFPRIFGANAFAVVGRPGKLIDALPLLYRHMAG